jgi:hypothetical protein
MVKYVRVKQPACALRHPEHGGIIVPDPAIPWREDDPLVKAFPWQFAADDEIGAEREKPAPDSVQIEQATKAPGEKRAYRRRAQ